MARPRSNPRTLAPSARTPLDPVPAAEVKAFCENGVPESGDASAKFFEDRARAFLEALIESRMRLDDLLTVAAIAFAAMSFGGTLFGAV